MKNFLKKNWEYVLVVFIGVFAFGAIALGFGTGSLRTDAGWDTDYDSGGYSSSDSGWSSSSSDYDWSSSSSSHSSTYSGDGSALGTLIVFAIIIIIIVLLTSRNKGNTASPTKNLVMRTDISEDEIKKILPNETLGSLKHMAYETFINVQNAWMDFDYDKLRTLCTDELYNSYTSQLDTLKIKNGKNIMSNFDQEEIKIIGIKKEGKMVTIEVYLRVTFYDYVINNKTEEVIRGTKTRTVTNNYEMQFVRKENDKEKETKCPNCGAPIKTVASTKCEYCGSTIVVDATEFVLSKKNIVNK